MLNTILTKRNQVLKKKKKKKAEFRAKAKEVQDECGSSNIKN